MEHACVGVIGLTGQSAFMQTERLPIPGQTVACQGLLFEPGGKGHNQAVACARMGADTVFVGAVGLDAWAHSCEQALLKQGIRPFLAQKPEPTAFAVITTASDGENTVMVYQGASRCLAPVDILQAAGGALRRCSLLLTQLEIDKACLRAILTLAEQTGARVVLNPAPAYPLPPWVVKACWLFTPNEEEANVLAGVPQGAGLSPSELARALRAVGITRAVVTLGAKGALLLSPEKDVLLPTYRVTPVDTTGAGDTFNGALAAALARGQELEQAARFAAAAAALCVTKRGAAGSIPTLKQVNELFYKTARE